MSRPDQTSGKRTPRMVTESPQDIGRSLPHSVEAEQGVLGSMLMGGRDVIEEVRAKVSDAMFYVRAHQSLFATMVSIHAHGGIVDLITYTQELRDADLLETVGGAAAVTGLFTFVPTAANVTYYLEILREKYILRQIIASCTQSIRRAFEEQLEVEGLLNDHVSRAIEIGQETSWQEHLKHIADFVPGAVQEIEATYYNRGEPVGLSTGFADLDRMTGGLQAPITYYIGGRPAMGKSSVLVEVADYIGIPTIATGKKVGIFSVEMTGRQLAKRILCNRASINLQRLRDGFLKGDELPKLKDEAARVSEGNVWIDDTGGLSIFEFRARARRGVLKFGWDLIIIDYLQRMRSTSKRAQGSRELEINEIAQGISETAKELNVPIIVLVQLNRENEKRTDKTPQLSDLRESGSIEQEARFVGLLHRPVYYAMSEAAKLKEARRLKIFNKTADKVTGEEIDLLGPDSQPIPDLDAFEQYAELHVVKQNEGPVGMVQLRFIKEFARLEGVTQKLYSNNPDERQEV